MNDEGAEVGKILIGGLVTLTGAVIDRRADGFLVQYERNGEVMRDWFIADELAPMSFDDGDGV
jgi:hypothetical protein